MKVGLRRRNSVCRRLRNTVDDARNRGRHSRANKAPEGSVWLPRGAVELHGAQSFSGSGGRVPFGEENPARNNSFVRPGGRINVTERADGCPNRGSRSVEPEVIQSPGARV